MSKLLGSLQVECLILCDFQKQPLDDIALTEMLTVDGVLKAVHAAIRQLQKNYQESDLKIWVDAHKMVRHAIRDASGGE